MILMLQIILSSSWFGRVVRQYVILYNIKTIALYTQYYIFFYIIYSIIYMTQVGLYSVDHMIIYVSIYLYRLCAYT